MDGQMNFDSGWEWGYWLSDMITARASWNPFLSPEIENIAKLKKKQKEKCQNDKTIDCKSKEVTDVTEESPQYTEESDQWEAMGQSLRPLGNVFGIFGQELIDLLVKLTQKQADLLMFGIVDGKPSPNLKKLR